MVGLGSALALLANAGDRVLFALDDAAATLSIASARAELALWHLWRAR